MGELEAGGRDDAPAEPQILFVSDERGWPQNSGYRRRTAQIVSTLAELGPVTWIAAPRNRNDPGGGLQVPDDLAHRISTRLVAAPTRSTSRTAVRWVTSRLPWPLAAGDWTAARRKLFRERHRHRIVWAMGVDALLAVEAAGVTAPVMIVDADLESLKLQRQLLVGDVDGPARRIIARIDVARWRRLERGAAQRVDGFSLCSDDEVSALGRNGFVTPNSYPAVTADRNRVEGPDRDRGPVLLFIGSLGYRSNLDGLEWFAEQVLPELQNRNPRMILRIVGSGLPSDHALHSRPGVDVAGRVDDVSSELNRSTAVVVPLRWGAGTRIKILEAFAHRVPVVSTTLGAEGLRVRDGQELLLADDESSFADACLSILGDEALGRRLSAAGYETFMSHYEESIVSHRLLQRLRALTRPDGSDQTSAEGSGTDHPAAPQPRPSYGAE